MMNEALFAYDEAVRTECGVLCGVDEAGRGPLCGPVCAGAVILRAGDVIVLSGDLGAGKTQFVQGVAAALGVRGPVTSPTFNILLSYLEGSLPLHHFDLYRLDDADELEDIGFYDTLDADGASFVEWGERFPDALPYGYLEVRITVDAEGNRVVRAHAFGDRARCLLTVWAKDSKSRLVKCAGGFA